MEEQFDHMDVGWNVLNSTDPDPFKDETQFKKCQKDHEEAENIKDKMMEAAKRTLDRAPTTGEASASIQEAIHCWTGYTIPLVFRKTLLLFFTTFPKNYINK